MRAFETLPLGPAESPFSPMQAGATLAARLFPKLVAAEAKAAPKDVGFGSVTETEHGAEIKPAKRFPLIPDVTYGWRLHIGDDRNIVRVREELELPKAPANWISSEPLEVSADGRTGVTEGVALVLNGILVHSWAVAPDDPPGRYILRLFVDDEPVRTFEFDLVEPANLPQ